MNQQIAASNRKAYHEYHILDKYEAGIELFGTEKVCVKLKLILKSLT